MDNISEKLNIISKAKSDIKTAIENKGGVVGNIGIQEYATKINELQIGASELEQELINSYISSIDGSSGANCTKIPDGVTVIGAHAFRYCTNLALTELPDGIVEIANLAFAYATALRLTKLPASLKEIGSSAFTSCPNVTFKEIPEGVRDFGTQIFMNCTGLTELTLKGNVRGIGKETFSGCTNLTKLIMPNITSVPSLSATTSFNNTPIANGTGYIYFPDELVETAKTQTNWTAHAAQIKGVSEL